MEKSTVFTGSAVAIITPFTDNKVDYEQFGKIIEFQIDFFSYSFV